VANAQGEHSREKALQNERRALAVFSDTGYSPGFDPADGFRLMRPLALPSVAGRGLGPTTA